MLWLGRYSDPPMVFALTFRLWKSEEPLVKRIHLYKFLTRVFSNVMTFGGCDFRTNDFVENISVRRRVQQQLEKDVCGDAGQRRVLEVRHGSKRLPVVPTTPETMNSEGTTFAYSRVVLERRLAHSNYTKTF